MRNAGELGSARALAGVALPGPRGSRGARATVRLCSSSDRSIAADSLAASHSAYAICSSVSLERFIAPIPFPPFYRFVYDRRGHFTPCVSGHQSRKSDSLRMGGADGGFMDFYRSTRPAEWNRAVSVSCFGSYIASVSDAVRVSPGTAASGNVLRADVSCRGTANLPWRGPGLQ